jgi:hypothetical protein
VSGIKINIGVPMKLIMTLLSTLIVVASHSAFAKELAFTVLSENFSPASSLKLGNIGKFMTDSSCGFRVIGTHKTQRHVYGSPWEFGTIAQPSFSNLPEAELHGIDDKGQAVSIYVGVNLVPLEQSYIFRLESACWR